MAKKGGPKVKLDRRRDKQPVPDDRRRGERRRDKRVPIELWIEEEDDDALYFQRSANLSAGGAYFVQTIPQPVGTRVRLRFTLPGEQEEITCLGEVVTALADELGMGVKFLDLPAAAKQRIEKLTARA